MRSSKLGPTERVYQRLKNDVILQTFGLGHRLTVSDLADRYVVSTTPVREALSRLHGEGLIDFRAGHGYYSKTPSLRELQDLFDLLRVIVTACLKKCKGMHSPAQAECQAALRADEILKELTETLEPADQQYLMVVALIESIVERCGNMMSLSLVQKIHAQTHFILRRAFADDCSATELEAIAEQLREAVFRQDIGSQEHVLSSYHNIMRSKLPMLLGNYVSEQYVGAI